MLAHARHLDACDVGAEVNREDPRYSNAAIMVAADWG